MCSCFRSRAPNDGSSTTLFTRIRCGISPGRNTAPPSSRRRPTIPRDESVLECGDVLYLPRGFIHSAEALGGVSVHLTIGIHNHTRHDFDASLARTLGRRSAAAPHIADGRRCGRLRPTRVRSRVHRRGSNRANPVNRASRRAQESWIVAIGEVVGLLHSVRSRKRRRWTSSAPTRPSAYGRSSVRRST